MKEIASLIVYHGRNNHQEVTDDILFFSSQKSFSSDYGEVKPYKISISNPFHTCSEEHITLLLEWNGKITDPYSGKQYRKYLNIYNSGLLYHDTWEMFEPHIDKVKRLGFDGMIIYEGGIENYICFQSEQYQVIENQE